MAGLARCAKVHREIFQRLVPKRIFAFGHSEAHQPFMQGIIGADQDVYLGDGLVVFAVGAEGDHPGEDVAFGHHEAERFHGVRCHGLKIDRTVAMPSMRKENYVRQPTYSQVFFGSY